MVVVFNDMVVIYIMASVVSTFVVEIFCQGCRLQAMAIPLLSKREV